MRENTEIKPSFVACLIDVSEYCSEGFLARCGGRVYESAFFDDNLNTYLCSATPCIFVESLSLVAEKYPEDEEAREALCSELLDVDLKDSYYERRDIERRRRESPDKFVALKVAFDGDDDPAEVVREYLQGNPCF